MIIFNPNLRYFDIIITFSWNDRKIHISMCERGIPREREEAKGRRRLGLEKIKPSDGMDTCVVVI